MRLWMDLIFQQFKGVLADELAVVVARDRAGDVADMTSAQIVIESYTKMVTDDDPELKLALYREHVERSVFVLLRS